MSFFSDFFITPIKYRSFALAKFRWTQLLHERTNGSFDYLYQRWCTFTRPALRLPDPTRLSRDDFKAVLSDLRREGCKVLPIQLTECELDELRRFVFSVPAYSRNISERLLIDSENVPNDYGRYYWPMHELVKCSAVKGLLADSTFCSIAQEYLGAEPILAHVTLWLDPVFDGYYDPHVYHYDNDGPGFLKFFFYITDVDEETGAHRYIKGTHGHTKPEKLKASKRYNDEELKAFYGESKEVIFSAPAGTIIAEDTAGFHRGTDLKRGYRLLMQFEFSLVDIPHDEDLAGVTAPVEFPELDSGIARIARKFYRR